MYLKSLEMQGFKSFPDKTKLTFSKGMTAVVGPNGSGKSNISDAVRWVLGEQSTKNLRGSKMEDVIFSGTGERKQYGFAEVTLTLDNSDRSLDFDSDEIKVTRRYYRSGESEYKINGASVRLRDINELFMDTGIGRDGYSLVSQGRIEDMVSAKGDERRQMFEEAAGISHYRYRREDAEKRLAGAEENLLRLGDIMSELEDRIEPLKEQSEKAKKFISLSEDKKEVEIGLWLDTIHKSDDSIRTVADKLTAVSVQRNEAVKKLEELQSETDSIDEETRNINLSIEKNREKSEELESSASEKESQIAVNENTFSHNEEDIRKEKDEKKKRDENYSRIDIEIEEKEKDKEDTEKKLDILSEEKTKIQEEISSLRAKENSVLEKINSLDSKEQKLNFFISEEKLKSASASSSLSEIEKRAASVNGEIEKKRGELEKFETAEKELGAKVEEINEKLKSLLNELAGRNLKISSKNRKFEESKFSLDKLGLDIETKKSRLRLLDDMEKNMDGYQGSVRQVMKEKKTGRLSGIIGPLSSLINTDSKYALAIETSLGAAIQDIVTENENDARNAMYFLKKNDLGRATFLPITSVRGRILEENGLSRYRGYISLACDLVDFDDKYRDIVYSFLGRVAVVEDTDTAIEIGRRYSHRFKIVTLDGQVMNAGGSMTGGSKIQHSGFLSRKNEREKLKTEIESGLNEYERKKEDLRRIKEELAQEKAQLDLTDAEIEKSKDVKTKLLSDLSVNEERINAAKNVISSLSDETGSASERTEKLKTDIDNFRKKQSEYEDEYAKIRRMNEEAAAEKKSLEENISSLGEKINEANLKYAGLEKDRDNIVSSLAVLRQQKTDRKDFEKRADEQIRILAEKNEEIKYKNDVLRKESESLRSEKKKISDEISALNSRRSEIESRTADLRQEERDKNDLKEKLSSEIVRLEEKKNSLEQSSSDLRNKLLEEYELTVREAEGLNIKLGTVAEARKKLSSIKSEINSLGSVNTGAIEEYKQVSERFDFMSCQIDDVKKSRDELRKLISDLTSSMKERFLEKFDLINKYFADTFIELFGGGKAELYIEDKDNILESEIGIKAQPPGKNVRNLNLLSGGEKGLTAIALLFAMLKVTPAPFCIFDEVEAALDDVNVVRYAKYIKSIDDKTQFILITHRRGTMEQADILYGVTMQEKGISKILKLDADKVSSELGLK